MGRLTDMINGMDLKNEYWDASYTDNHLVLKQNLHEFRFRVYDDCLNEDTINTFRLHNFGFDPTNIDATIYQSLKDYFVDVAVKNKMTVRVTFSEVPDESDESKGNRFVDKTGNLVSKIIKRTNHIFPSGKERYI